MITAFIFFVHLIFGLVIFTKKWQDENLSAGFLNITLIAILFAVGWTITGIVAKVVMEPKGLGMQFDRDAFSIRAVRNLSILSKLWPLSTTSLKCSYKSWLSSWISWESSISRSSAGMMVNS